MSYNKYPWQVKALELIESESNIILSSPTGSGKTIVFMEWALSKGYKIIITSPIKALSSQRFKELDSKGYNMAIDCIDKTTSNQSIIGYPVALETGDIKYIPDGWEILCCTSEIYALKYVNMRNVVVIMDEFHYCFENKERTRAFIDGVVFSEAAAMCICSATLGNVSALQNYLERISGRRFTLCASDERITELKEVGRVSLKNLKNALVVAFSVDNCSKIINYLIDDRNSKFYPNKKKKVSKKYKQQLALRDHKERIVEDFASKYNVSGEVVDNAKIGLALFHGKILPKEKDFIATLFEERIIDTVVGTDALSIGVNFPVEKVVFCQLVKYPGDPISKNMFDQIAGRAGRKGYFDTGYYGFSDDLETIEFKGFYTDEEYSSIVGKKNESFVIELTPRIDLLLQEKVTIEDEVKYIIKYSSIRLNKDYIQDDIASTLITIQDYPSTVIMSPKQKREYQTFIPYCYFNEFTPEENSEILHEILKYVELQDNILDDKFILSKLTDANKVIEYIQDNYSITLGYKEKKVLREEISHYTLEKALAIFTTNKLIASYYSTVTDYYVLLKIRRYLTRLPYSLSPTVDLKTIEDKINSIDSSSLNYRDPNSEEQ